MLKSGIERSSVHLEARDSFCGIHESMWMWQGQYGKLFIRNEVRTNEK